MNSINNDAMAVNVADNLNSHYGRLKTSVQRLSSGLRINSAADDAAGLAIRELMRSDIAALNQGVRNVNDAISMLQTADAALAIIDEKLIRMKELAEQAATGTYDSTQRLMIDSEFQAMAAEIDRIANATDFNGIKLLDGSLSGVHDGSGLISTGAMKIHFGTANDSAEDYYYVSIDDCTAVGLGLGSKLPFPDAPPSVAWINEAKIDYAGRHIILDIQDGIAGHGVSAFMKGLDFYQLPVGLENITITSNGSKAAPFHKPHVCLFTSSGHQLTGVQMPTANNFNETWTPDIIDRNGNISGKVELSRYWWNNQTGEALIAKGQEQGVFDAGASYSSGNAEAMQSPGAYIMSGSFAIATPTGINEFGSSVSEYRGTLTDEIYTVDKITKDLVFFIGGHDNPSGGCNRYRLLIEADITETFLQKLKAWAGEGDPGRGADMLHIDTQQKAQEALIAIDGAIEKKDQIRAHLGALQNRLENTVANLTIQAENLQASEARISDADIADEMADFVRNQILTQSATAMLGQANSYPHMLLRLLES